jgi:hypothetical protein
MEAKKQAVRALEKRDENKVQTTLGDRARSLLKKPAETRSLRNVLTV